MAKISAIATAILLIASTASTAAECLQYEPAEATLDGTLESRVYPGPPNYESTSKGDGPEAALILVLSSPICVSADPNSELDSERATGVRAVQLAVTGGSYESLLGQKVQVSGSLFSAHTGHHHTRVLLTVASLRAATEFTSASASDGLCPNAVTTLEINRCLSKEIAHAESDLNRYLAEARRLLAEESEAAAALDRAQASWLAYRDADCNAVFELYAQGTIRGPMGGGCKLIRTQRRIHDIWETYLRSTDAPLPEPKKP